MEAEYYSEKSIAVFGETKPWAADMRALGGIFNKNLRGRPGWIFPRTKEPELMQFIANANAGFQQPTVAVSTATQAQLVPIGGAPVAMTPHAALTRLQVVQPVMTQLRLSKPNEVSPTPISERILDKPLSLVPAPVTVVPPQPTTVSYPNLFIAADGLSYQIILYTVPMPTIGQQVTVTLPKQICQTEDVTLSDEVETILNYTVSRIEKQTPPFDSIVITRVVEPVEEQEPVQSRAVLINGVWKIRGMQDEHTLTFLP